MEFCSKCGSVILVTDKKKAVCAKCGHRPKGKVKIQALQDVAKSGGIVVLDEKKLNTYPVVDKKCPECKNKNAYFWIMQTRSADEAETKFYRCVKCEHTWREYR